MARLYWRVKRQGKWTWKPATMVYSMMGKSPEGLEYWCIAADDYLEEEE